MTRVIRKSIDSHLLHRARATARWRARPLPEGRRLNVVAAAVVVAAVASRAAAQIHCWNACATQPDDTVEATPARMIVAHWPKTAGTLASLRLRRLAEALSAKPHEPRGRGRSDGARVLRHPADLTRAAAMSCGTTRASAARRTFFSRTTATRRSTCRCNLRRPNVARAAVARHLPERRHPPPPGAHRRVDLRAIRW